MQSGTHTHYFHIRPTLPVLSTQHYRCLHIIPSSGSHYWCLVRDSTGVYASSHIRPTLSALMHHPASDSHYRHSRITPHWTHTTGAYTSPPLDSHYWRLRIILHHAYTTGAYTSLCIGLTLLALTHHPTLDSRYRHLCIIPASSLCYRCLYITPHWTHQCLCIIPASGLCYQHLRVIPTLPVLKHHPTLDSRYWCLCIIPTSGLHYRHLRIIPTLPALMHHPASDSHYRCLCIIPVSGLCYRHLHIIPTGTYASPHIGLMLPVPMHHPCTGLMLPVSMLLALTHHPATGLRYQCLLIKLPASTHHSPMGLTLPVPTHHSHITPMLLALMHYSCTGLMLPALMHHLRIMTTLPALNMQCYQCLCTRVLPMPLSQRNEDLAGYVFKMRMSI